MKNQILSKLNITIVLVSFLAVGCAEMQAEQLFTPPIVDNKPPTTTLPLPNKPERPICEYNPVEFDLDVTLEGLTMDDGQGSSGSFNGSNQNISIGLDFTVRKAITSYSMSLRSLVNDNLISTRKDTTKSDISFSFRAAYNGIGGGLSVQAVQSLAKIAGYGLKDTFKELKKVVDAKKATPWETQIVDETEELPGVEYTIPISSMSGAQVGDKFDVYNFTPKWFGVPCEPQSEFSRTNYRKVATVKLKNFGRNMATVEVIGTPSEKIMQTARVVQNIENKRKLFRAVRVNKAVSLGLVYVGTKDPIDFGLLMQTQIPSLVSEGGFYLR